MALVARADAAQLAGEKGPHGREAVPRCSSYAHLLAQETQKRDNRRGDTGIDQPPEPDFSNSIN